MRGELDTWCACTTAQDVRTVQRVLGDLRQRIGYVVTRDAIDLVDLLEDQHQPVVLGPYSMESTRRELLGAAALTDGGIEVAFRGGFPVTCPQALRMTAALAVRNGMDAAAARRGITIVPAKVAGVADRIGSIAPGKDADLVVFSNDPLRIDAQVLEVYVRGQRVYCATCRSPATAGGKP